MNNNKERIRQLVFKDMFPNRNEFEKLGFEFEEIEGEWDFCMAILPEGWTLKEINNYTKVMYDENGVKRVIHYCREEKVLFGVTELIDY